MRIPMSLANQFLIATPSINASNFARSVIYVCEHHEQGTVGLIINRPMHHTLALVFEQLRIKPTEAQMSQKPLLFGGPTQPERGFVIHRSSGHWQSSLALQEDVVITTSNDIIRAIADGFGPKEALVILGYVAWDMNQLEQEIMDNAWLVCPYSSELLYEVPFESRWEYAGSMLGVNMSQLIGDAGHA